ncbi:MAG: sialidase family protein [Promethearchaeia archaeon]
MKKSLKSIGYGLYFLIQIITGLSLPILAILYFLCNQAAMVNLLAILLILIPYIGFFTIITLYYGIMGLSSLIRGRKVENLELFPWEKRLKTSSLIARKQLTVGIVLVIGFLFMTVIDYFQPVSLFTLVIIPLVLVMGGYSLIFFLNFLSFLIQKISIKRNIKQKNWQQISACHLPGSITILFVLLLFIPLAIPTYFLNDPQFSDGLSLQKDLFIGGQEGYKTYRIPSLLIVPKGAQLNNSEILEDDLVLAFCEGRKYNTLDTGEIDIVMKRSEDGGDIWSDLEVLVESGNNFDNIKYGNQMTLFDNETGTIFLLYLYHNYNSGETGNFVIQSEDGGKDWSSPKSIDVNPLSSGHGIQLKYGVNKGRLLATSFVGESGNSAAAIYSDDHGKTWKNGKDIGGGDECEAIETVDGRIYMTLRKNAPLGTFAPDHRQYAWSEDGGKTWSEPKEEKDLPTPICLGSIIRLTDNITYEENRILFSNPADYVDRAKMTVRLSYDECESWNEGKLIYDGPSGYSQVGVHHDKTI